MPPRPGVLSALGLLVASVEHDAVETVAVLAAPRRRKRWRQSYGAPGAPTCAALMAADRVPDGEARPPASPTCATSGQGYTLDVPVPLGLDDEAIAEWSTSSTRPTSGSTGIRHPGAEIEFVNVRVVQEWGRRGRRAPDAQPDSMPPGAGQPSAYFDELGGYVDTPIYQRSALQVGDEITGPAIVEQADTTLVVYPGQRAVLDSAHNLIVAVPSGLGARAKVAVAS